MRLTRPLATIATVAVATIAFAPAADAMHHGYRHHGYRHHHAHAAGALLVPAHQRPDYVGLAGAPLPGLIDLGLGPVFPFGG